MTKEKCDNCERSVNKKDISDTPLGQRVCMDCLVEDVEAYGFDIERDSAALRGDVRW